MGELAAPVTRVRAAVRLLALAVLTAAVWSSCIASRLLCVLSRRTAGRVQSSLVGVWARGAARILGMRIEVRGPPPAPPFFLVANHVSYLDVLVLLGTSRGVLLAKAEISRWPVAGFLAGTTGTLFVDRQRKADIPRVIEQARRTLERGVGVIVFPEGTTHDGVTLGRFNPSLLEVPVRTGHPVACAAIRYDTEGTGLEPRDSVCWWDDTPLTEHVARVLRLDSFRAIVTYSPTLLGEGDRKALASRARSEVDRMLS